MRFPTAGSPAVRFLGCRITGLPRRIPLSAPALRQSTLPFDPETIATAVRQAEGAIAALTRSASCAVSSGTAAIHLALKCLGVRAGDEVVAPTLTYIATCNPILYEQCAPVFVDCHPQSWMLDPERLAQLLKRRAAAHRLPRAILAADLYGQCADWESIRSICREYELPIIEDAAEAFGAWSRGEPSGAFGDLGVFSFNCNKIVTGLGGGMLVSNQTGVLEKAMRWRNHSRQPGLEYLHHEVGYNYRMSPANASIVLSELPMLETHIRRRRAIFKRYCDAFADCEGIEPQAENWAAGPQDDKSTGPEDKSRGPVVLWSGGLERSRHTRWLSCFLIGERKFGMSAEDLIRYLDAANVESRPVWKPMHTQPLYRKCERVGGAVAEDLNRRGICLPSSSCLTEEEQQYVIDRVREAHFAQRRPQSRS